MRGWSYYIMKNKHDTLFTDIDSKLMSLIVINEGITIHELKKQFDQLYPGYDSKEVLKAIQELI